MRRFLLFACLLVLACCGCSKHETGCTPVEPQVEEPQILGYAAKDSIQVTKHSSGIYYQIIDPGSGAVPPKGSTITVGYVGRFLNDKIFEQSTSYTKGLSDLIEGWQIGIPLIKKGGRIKLIIPSSLAYGCNPKKDADGNVVIPGNSVLYYDINLIKFQ